MRLNQIQTQFFPVYNSPLITNNSNPSLLKITLNRPQALNSLSHDDLEALIAIFKYIRDNDKIKVVVLKGKGGKSFCAGGDLLGLIEAKKLGKRKEILDIYYRYDYYLDNLVSTLNKPIISFMQGFIIGSGVGLSINSEIKIVSENSIFIMPEAKIGFCVDVGAGHFLNKIKYNIGNLIALASYQIKGYEIVELGLANYFVPLNNISALKQHLFQSINELTTKEQLHQIVNKYSQKQEIQLSYKQLAIDYFDINQPFSDWYHKLKKDEPKLFNEIMINSPIAIRVIYRYLQECKTLPLKEVYKMDLRLAKHIIKYQDFWEGIKKIVYNKSYEPIWAHNTPLEVTEKELDEIFESLGDEELEI